MSSDLIAQKERELENVEKEYKDLMQKASDLENLVQKCRERDTLVQDYSRAVERLNALSQQEYTIVQKKKLLDTALELLPYLPRVVQYKNIVSEWQDLTRERKEKEAELKGILRREYWWRRNLRRWKGSLKTLKIITGKGLR